MSGRSPNVLHLIAPARFGGLEKVVHLLAAAQHRAGLPTLVMVLHGQGLPEPPIADALRDDGVEVLPLALPNRAYLAQLATVRTVVETRSVGVLHTHGYHPDVLAAALGRRIPAARVSTVHGFTGGGARNRVYEWLQCRSYARFDGVIAVSRKLSADLESRGVHGDRLHVLPNAWAVGATPLEATAARASLGVPDGVFSVGWVGRVSREKGLDVLIEALPRLGHLPLQVTVLGDGREREAVAKRADALGVSARVAWRGAVPDAASLLPGFDLLVLSSRTEGTPMVLLEAMSARVPVLATAVGGIPDVVSATEALLVPPEDPAAIASAIRAAHDDPAAQRERATRAARRLAEHFAIEPWLDAHNDVYRAALVRAQQGTR